MFWIFWRWKMYFWAKKLMEIPYSLITEKFLFWSFWKWKIRSFFDPKSWSKDYIYWLLKVLAFNFLVVVKTVFFWVKKLMERWNLLATKKFLFLTFWWLEIWSFFSQKVDEKMIFTWPFWAFRDIPGLEKYGFLCRGSY